MSQPGKEAGNLWQLWFDIRTAARAQNWEKFQNILDKHADIQMTAHPFLTESFQALANANQTALVKSMFTRGFKADAETLSDTANRLARYYHPQSADVMAYLIAEQGVDPKEAVYFAASQGKLAVLQTIESAGGDIRAGNSAFFLALYGGHPAVMHYLYEKGADIYHPNMIAAGYGRNAEIPEAQRRIALDTYRELVDLDNQAWAECYAESGGAAEDIDAFRKVPNALGRAPMSRLQLAVRADKFEDVVAVAAADKAAMFPLSAKDLLIEDFKGVSPLMVMAARGKLKDVFDPKLWSGRPEEVQVLHDALKNMRAEKTIDLQAFSAEMDRYRLKQAKKKAPRLTLKPRP
jgi:hypothetical protein